MTRGALPSANPEGAVTGLLSGTESVAQPETRTPQPLTRCKSGAKNISVRHCDLTNNNTAALQATSPDQTIEVTECAGYNDKATSLATAPPLSTQVFYATATYGYCGPMAFYVSGGTVQHVRINGNITGLLAGGFTLSPGETGRLDYSATPTYYAVGR